MLRLGRRIRTISILAAALALAGVGAQRLWGWPRMLSDPLARGIAAYDQSDWATAADLARKRLLSARDDNQALRLLARASVRLGRDQTATAHYRKLMKQKNRELKAEDYYLLGLALHHQHQIDEAVKAWETGCTIEPERPEILDELARAYSEQNRFVAAAAVAERLAKQPSWNVRASLMLGELRSTLNDPSGAVDALQQGVQDQDTLRKATSAPSLFRKILARNLLKLGRPDPARTQLQTVLDGGPDPEASWLLSRAELQDGAITLATAALSHAGSYRAEHPLEEEPGPYIGAERCAPCHRDLYRATLSSRHAQSLYRGDQLKKVPLPERPLEDPGDPSVTHTIYRSGDHLQVDTRAHDRIYRSVIDYAFGTHDRYLTMVGRDEQGESRAVRLSYYHSTAGSGWDVSAGDVARPDREQGFLGRPIETRQGAVRCLYCHATNVRGGSNQTGPETADPGIGCERCHGPGGNHLKAVEGQFPDMAIAASTLHLTRSLTRLCNDCHTLHSADVDSKVPRTDPIWHRSPGVSFTWSRCSIASGENFNCLTCHEPHRPTETSTAYYEAKCLSCHRGTRSTASTNPAGDGRDRHEQMTLTAANCPVSPQEGCLKCHMPRVPNALLHIPLTDHYIRVRKSSEP